VFAQNVTIFFLKDGSIVQGKVVNENQNRIFLKTEQGTIKILPMNILGREDLAREGDLTYMTDRVDHLQNHLDHITGKVNQLSDSLKMTLDDLYDFYKNLEVMQNEFEIDLLRLYSRSREQNIHMENIQSDMINHQVDIAFNRQNHTGLSDTVLIMQKQFHKASRKLDNTANQSLLLSGAVSNIKSELQTAISERKGHQNQIDIMAGSLAHLIQEVQKVQTKSLSMEEGINTNKKTIDALTGELKIQTKALIRGMEIMLDDFNTQVNSINLKLDTMSDHSTQSRKMISSQVEKIKEDYKKLESEVIGLSRKLKKVDEKVDQLPKE
jgi:chromosome segregation ATPase